MKKKKGFYLLLLLLIATFALPASIKADELAKVLVGSKIVEEGTSQNIYGGNVKLEKESGSQYILTLKNVNVNEYVNSGTSAISIYFAAGNLTVKLEGNNTISSSNEPGSTITNYMAISVKKNGETRNLNIIGDGILNLEISGYNVISGIYSDYVAIGQKNNKGPIINANLNGTDNSLIELISNDFDIYNSTIKGNIRGKNVLVLYSEEDTGELEILNSDINLEIEGSNEVSAIYAIESPSIVIENTDMLVKMKAITGTTPTKYSIAADKILTIKDSRIMILSLDEVDEDMSIMHNSSTGYTKFIHTEGKDFLFYTNSMISSEQNIQFTNITNKMVYVSDEALDKVKQNDTFNLDDLITKKYIVISTDIDNKIISGDNQNVKQTMAESYKIVTNHFIYLVQNVKLDDTLLSTEDYTLEKNGEVSLTKAGLNKLFSKDLGTHKLEVNYYFGNKVTSNINLVSKDYVEESQKQNNNVTNTEINPKTGDNISSNIIIGGISLICLIGCCLYFKKRKFN